MAAGTRTRLEAEEIPLGARIVAVCDAFRAMIEPRPYRPARSIDEARLELLDHAGTQFDTECVDASHRGLARGDREDGEVRCIDPWRLRELRRRRVPRRAWRFDWRSVAPGREARRRCRRKRLARP